MEKKSTDNEEVKYFRIARELNHKYHKELLKKKLHIRGNKNSLSIISVNKDTAEKGISNIKNEEQIIEYIKSDLTIEEPQRKTPEKELQAWMILYSMKNDGKLPFCNNISYLTSEIALKIDGEKKVNDILAIDSEGRMCIVELKSKRHNKVKKQAIDFENVVNTEKAFFINLLKAISTIGWNGEIRKIAVWPRPKGTTKEKEYREVEEINYFYDEVKNEYKFE